MRFGVGEIYGHDFARLSPEEIRRLSVVRHTDQPCPFRGANCNKKRGICTLRPYDRDAERGIVPAAGPLVTLCPERFKEAGIVQATVSEVLLGTPTPSVVREIYFLQQPSQGDEDGEPVGRIDNILIVPGSDPLRWCAVELQAVYFSGKGMKSQYEEFARWVGPGIPWPNEVRRPDFRSSGPKRLMPQLQTKIPTLRRWGKKMAVVTDRAFFESMGSMREVRDISNCDIVWFVFDYEKTETGFRLAPCGRHLISLESAIEGLIAGEPVALAEFERRIHAKLAMRPPRRGRAR